MKEKTKGLVVSFISVVISFLSLLLMMKLAVRVDPALAHREWVRILSFDQPTSIIRQPLNADWLPPTWFPESSRDELWVLQGIRNKPKSKKKLRLKSRAAIVYDLDRGEVLFEKNADTRWPVASLTKVVSALALASMGGDLDQEQCLDRTIYANFPGATTRFRSGSCVKGWDLLGSALVGSDNGGAFGLAHVADVPHGPFIDQMNSVAAELEMSSSSFVDPAGVNDENISTARDVTRAVVALSKHPTLSVAASAPFWDVDFGEDRGKRTYYSTNRYAQSSGFEFSAAKTGFTYTARNCFTAVVTRKGRTLAVTTLGAYYKKDRWKDFKKLVDWSIKNK